MRRSWFTGIFALIVLVILFSSSVYYVKEGEYKVVLQFGEVVRHSDQPGINFKIPFIEDLTVLPKYQMIFDSQPNQLLTKDKKMIVLDNYTVWKITDVKKFLRNVSSVKAGEDLIDAAVYGTVRRRLAEVNFGEIVSENTERGNLGESMTKEIQEFMERDQYGIEIVDVRIKRTDLPPENKKSVYNRMISDRQSMAARYLSEGDEESRKITAKADREARELLAQAETDAKKIIASGEQEAARIYNDSYGKDPAFYELYRTLDSYLTTLNGEPVIMLPIQSPYTQLLLGNK